DLRADSRDLHFPREQRQGRAPVGTLPRANFGYSVIRRHVKPGPLSVDDIKVSLGRFIFPAHLARSRKIGCSGFHPNFLAAFKITLKEGRAQSASSAVALFEPSDRSLDVLVRGGCRPEDASRQKATEAPGNSRQTHTSV